MAYMCFASIKIKPFFLIARRISEAAIGGVRAGDLIFLSLCGPVERKKAHDADGPSTSSSSILFNIFEGSNKKQRSCDGRGGAQRPVWLGNEPKKTGARSARARTRGQNPLVIKIFLYFSQLFIAGSLL